MTRILIAGKYSIIRYGLRHIIKEYDDSIICELAEEADKVFELLKRKKFDILVLDIDIPPVNGLSILKEIRVSEFNVPVLILSTHYGKQYAEIVKKYGADGFIYTINAPERLITAINKIISGDKYTDPDIDKSNQTTDITKYL
jgi:DNA-binding NarL/FixJ family response regulator